MNLLNKELLKQLDVLFLSQKDNSFNKIKDILTIFFKKVIICDSINIAKDKYNNCKPMLLIVDINLKNSNGINFIKEVRKNNKSIPILIITKNQELNNLLEAIKLNLVDYLLKPLDINKLINSLNLSAKLILNSKEIKTTIKNEVEYDYIEKSLIIKNKITKLTKTEAKLFELFLINKNKYINKENIRKQIWSDKEISESALKSLLSRLIKKVGNDTITNSFGIGYGIFDK